MPKPIKQTKGAFSKANSRLKASSTNQKKIHKSVSSKLNFIQAGKHATKFSDHLFKQEEMRNYILPVENEPYKYSCDYCQKKYNKKPLSVDGLRDHIVNCDDHEIAVPKDKKGLILP